MTGFAPAMRHAMVSPDTLNQARLTFIRAIRTVERSQLAAPDALDLPQHARFARTLWAVVGHWAKTYRVQDNARVTVLVELRTMGVRASDDLSDVKICH